MRYLLVPLLMVSMSLSFAAALVAMLFYTGEIASPTELVALVRSDVDHSRLSSEHLEPEDEMSQLARTVEAYRSEYETRLDSLASERDNLASVTAQVVSIRAALDAEADRLGLLADSTALALKRRRIALLVPGSPARCSRLPNHSSPIQYTRASDPTRITRCRGRCR